MKTIPKYTIALALVCVSFCTPQLAARTKYVKVTPAQDLAALIRNARANTAFLRRMRT